MPAPAKTPPTPLAAAILKRMAELDLRHEKDYAEHLGVAQPTVNRWVAGKSQPTGKNLMALEKDLGQSVTGFLRGADPTARKMTVLVGYVGAGAEMFAFDDHALGGGLALVESPPGVEGELIAVQIKGDSWEPAYQPGDVLFYSTADRPPIESCLNRVCVVKIVDGRYYVKLLKRHKKTGHFTLLSTNAKPIGPVRIDWASPVVWVKKR